MAIASLKLSIWLRCYLPIISLELSCNFSELSICGIECVAIGNNFWNICMKLCRSQILICFQIILNAWKIHWLFYYFTIMRYSEGYRINWLPKRPRCLWILQKIQNFNARLQRFRYSLERISLWNIFLWIILLINGILNFFIEFIIVSLISRISFIDERCFNFLLNSKIFTFVDFFLISTGAFNSSLIFFWEDAALFNGFGSNWSE